MTTIPIEICKIEDDLRDGFHILCRVHIRDREFRMLVDTGASMTIFSIKKAKDISDNELEINEQKVLSVGTPEIDSKYVVIDQMIIGDIVIDNYKTILIDLKSLNDHFRNNALPLIDGILGGDILMKYNAIIDYEKREITLI